jgi:GT2 family glycosyltransferase
VVSDGCLEYLSVKRVAIILVNWNGWRDTIECLDSLLLLKYPDFRIVVCDNGSSDGSLREIRAWADRHEVQYAEYRRVEAEAGGSTAVDPVLTLIRNYENLGFAGGNNVGLRHVIARGDADYCWLLNNDTVVEPDALTYLVARMQQQPSVGMCGSTLLMYDNRNQIQALGGGCYCRWIGLPWHYGRINTWGKKIDERRAEAWMNYVEGASMLVSRQFLSEVGLMCEDYFLYFEEADWAIRANGRFRLGYAAQSIVYHKVGGSIGTSSNPTKQSDTGDYFNIRNRLLFTRRFFPAALPTVWLVITGALLLRVCMGRWDRAMMIFRLLCGDLEQPAVMQSDHTLKP